MGLVVNIVPYTLPYTVQIANITYTRLIKMCFNLFMLADSY